MDVRAILAKKRDGGELSEGAIRDFLSGYVAGEVPDHAASALLMAIFIHGLAPRELEAWTRAMLESGRRLDLGRIPRRKADKHSTGGIGDKVSIPLAPAVAACGVAVPMISGRGLGHTGGTLDKLESIPGFRTDLSAADFARQLERTGVAFGGQTEDLAPADRKLYALRDVTGLIESIPLIASSILSKKLAEDLDALVLDVKFGSGAFLADPARGRELAEVMQRLAASMGVRTSALLTNMARPLGRAAGHALEIAESLECLGGAGPRDLRELVCLLGGEMLRLCGAAADAEDGSARIARALDDGRALEVFERAVGGQGGDARAVRDPTRLPRSGDVEPWKAPRAGHLGYADLRRVGAAIVALGGGRTKLGETIDPAVGLVFLRGEGERVEAGEPLVEIHHRAGRGLGEARALLGRGIEVGEPAAVQPLVLARLEG